MIGIIIIQGLLRDGGGMAEEMHIGVVITIKKRRELLISIWRLKVAWRKSIGGGKRLIARPQRGGTKHENHHHVPANPNDEKGHENGKKRSGKITPPVSKAG